MTATPEVGTRRRWALAAAVVALATFLPFLRGAFVGHSFYFRDLPRHFFPLRQFAVDGLFRGELRYWNPYVHEGEAAAPPVSYPLDLLQALLPGEAGFSLVLALHVPLAAVTSLLLGRGLGLSPVAAAGGAITYALGGFCLSSLNLYVHLESIAWAPLVVLGLLHAARGSSREIAAGGLFTAIALSTTGVEIVGQAILLALVLAAARPGPRRWPNVGASLVLALGLTAPTFLYMHRIFSDSERGSGFSPGMVLAFSVHPLTFLQVLVGALHGDPANMVNRFWGGNFFPGYPYFFSFYLGAAALCVAAVGVSAGKPYRGPLCLVAAVAGLVCMGPWTRLDLVVQALPALRAFRFPSKAFFTIHVAIALLTAFGTEALVRGTERRAWRLLAGACAVLGGGLALASTLPDLLPGATQWFLSGFLPPAYTWPRRLETARFILDDAFQGGLVALVVGMLALLVLSKRVRPGGGGLAIVALIAADLLRAGAGLNPMVKPSFFGLSSEMARHLADFRAAGRIFTCDPELGSAYAKARSQVGGRFDTWMVATYLETLVPSFNVPLEVRSAYSRDLGGPVPERHVLPATEAGCASFDAIAGRLRRASVARVISVAPIEHPSLELRAVVRPSRVAPLAIFVHAVRAPLPLRFVATNVVPAPDAAAAASLAGQPGFQEAGSAAVEGWRTATSGSHGSLLRMEETPGEVTLVVEADRPTAVVVRDSYAPGWRAWVNGAPSRVLRADGRHRAVEVGPGRSEVRLSYDPPGVRSGLLVAALAAAALLFLWIRSQPRAHLAEPSGSFASHEKD